MQILVCEDEKTRSTEPDPKAAPQQVAIKVELGHAETSNCGADGLGDNNWKQ